jgi:adenosylmethionine-8-amino-7-oxononanoate aminotransferase
MIWAFEADSPRADFSRWCFAEALAREVLLRPIGHTVYFMPPYVTSDADWGLLVDATLAILDDA